VVNEIEPATASDDENDYDDNYAPFTGYTRRRVVGEWIEDSFDDVVIEWILSRIGRG
jgi:hypothetical protein